MWARTAQVAAARLTPDLGGAANGDAGFYRAKLTTAQFYMERVLPQAGALLAGIKAGKGATMAMEEAAF